VLITDSEADPHLYVRRPPNRRGRVAAVRGAERRPDLPVMRFWAGRARTSWPGLGQRGK